MKQTKTAAEKAEAKLFDKLWNAEQELIDLTEEYIVAMTGCPNCRQWDSLSPVDILQCMTKAVDAVYAARDKWETANAKIEAAKKKASAAGAVSVVHA